MTEKLSTEKAVLLVLDVEQACRLNNIMKEDVMNARSEVIDTVGRDGYIDAAEEFLM